MTTDTPTLELIALEKRYKERCGRLSAYYYQMRYRMNAEDWRALYDGRQRVYHGQNQIYQQLEARPVRAVMLARMQWREGKR